MKKTLIAPAYAYQQFTDDSNIVAFFDAFNQMATETLTWLAEHPFPLYIGSYLTGGFLDYCAYCLYGQFRYKISYVQLQQYGGALNDQDINRIAIDEIIVQKNYLGTTINDDLFKRILTWNLYKGDGLSFTIPWLKRRIMRFLTGNEGQVWRFNSCQNVDVKVKGRIVAITITPGDWDSSLISVLDRIINNGILNIPPIYNYAISERQS
ncbi:hypothetical protein GT348_03865 [Aristophania vespae]|uniref:DUF2612 domain-containing protein n=1 Tax=Aristophania vespae TaxID=2697033 RepID=A0A6P1NDC9_9PROT|nr:hypothetical protein [Aristophania vespae]QHI95518.1 hypothetical protein GT348_03865 [Aristophania vespae]